MEELVANFTASRKGLLAFATTAAMQAKEEDIFEEPRPKKRRKVETHPITNGVDRRSTRSQSKRQASLAGSQQSTPTVPEVIADSEDEGSEFEDTGSNESPHFANAKTIAQPHDGLVECPCCHRRMKETLINSHLDRCVQGDSRTPVDDRAAPSSPALDGHQVAPPGTIAYSQQKPKQNDRLPFINYSLFTDTKLRQKLKELGISNTGSKDIMRRRHTEWVNLWNANCDSTSPVARRELLRELKTWEDTLGRQLERPTTNTGFMAKDFDRDRHVRKQKDNFDDLIRQARERANVKATEPEEKSTSSNADKDTIPQATSAVPDEPANSEPYPERDPEPQVYADAEIAAEKERACEMGATIHADGTVTVPPGIIIGFDTGVSGHPWPVARRAQPTVENGTDGAPQTPSKKFFV